MGFAPSRRLAATSGDYLDDIDVRVNEQLGSYPNGRRCFYCGEVLRDANDERTVYWRSEEDERAIFFHPRCAQTLGGHLIKDGILAEKPHLLRRSLPDWAVKS